MRTNTTNMSWLILACAGTLGSCAATVPPELVNARAAYQRASTGPAAEVAPADLHVADQALAKAEQSFEDDPRSYETRDLAYVAQRRAELAEAKASIAVVNKRESQAKSDYQTTQGEIVKDTKRDLSQTREALVAAEHSGEMSAERLSTEQAARASADQRASDAQAALAKLAAVRHESRGTVITLSGSVLFASNQADLLPAAQSRLAQVAEVLLASRERDMTIEGHTDSQGSDGHNLELSQRRADAVRSYLVQRGYEPDRIRAQGLGESRPVADNASAEGRANNRRVEIIVKPEVHASNR